MVHQVQLVREMVGDQCGADSRPSGDLREARPGVADLVQCPDGGLHNLLAPRFGDERPFFAADGSIPPPGCLPDSDFFGAAVVKNWRDLDIFPFARIDQAFKNLII